VNIISASVVSKFHSNFLTSRWDFKIRSEKQGATRLPKEWRDYYKVKGKSIPVTNREGP
jgi:hypothetical protein